MKTSILAAVISLLAISCSNDPDPVTDTEKKPGIVVNSELIGGAKAGIPVQLDLRFSLHNSCSTFEDFESRQEADTLVVTVWGLTAPNVACTKEIRYHVKRFTHTYPAAGTYYLKYVKDAYVSHRDTLVVAP